MGNQAVFHVSVIIPMYNAEKFINEAIKSVIKQSTPALEIIVIDDCSLDRSYNIVKGIAAYNEKIKLYQLPKNMGVSAARNFGINCAKGNWILFLDADDIIDPNLIQRMYERLQALRQINGENWVLIYPAFQQINVLGVELDTIFSVQRGCDEVLGYELVRNEIISPSGVMVNRQTIIEVGGFDEDISYSEDWDLWLKIANKGGFAYINSPLVKIRRHNENASRDMGTMLKAELVILKKYSLSTIKEAILRRRLTYEQNILDYISILFRLDFWDLGNRFLDSIPHSERDNASFYFYKGIYFLKKNEILNARLNFESSLQLNPQHGASLNNLAVILVEENKINESKQLFIKALSIYTGYIDAQKNLNKLLDHSNKRFYLRDMKITWRELRTTLLRYSD